MSKKNNGASNALVQGSILAVASIISRIIGLIYRIPMQRILGDIGIGYYSTAFEIYNVMLIISSYSLPLAVSKMVSAQMAKKRRTATYQILKCALLFATISGTTVALILFLVAIFCNNASQHTIQYFCFKSTGSGAFGSCSARRHQRLFPGTGNHDAECRLTNNRTDSKCHSQCMGCICAIPYRYKNWCSTW